MNDDGFSAIAASLRVAMLEYYRVSGERPNAAAWHTTLETNSGYVERRAGPLISLYLRHAKRRSLRGVRVADLGCGFGALAVYFAAQGATVVGIDPNGPRLEVGREVAERHRLPVLLERGYMQSLPWDSGTYDLAIQNNSLCSVVEHGERARAVREAWRVLRPGGLLLVRNPNRWALVDQFTGLPALHMLPPAAADRAARTLGRHRSQVRLLSPYGARRELQAAGFAPVVSVSPFASRWPSVMLRFSRYQHLVATRAPDAGPA